MTNWAIDWKCTLQHESVLVLCATLFDASVSMVAISANSSCVIYCPLAYCRYSVGLSCNSQNSLTILSNIVVVQSCARFHSLMFFDYSYLAIAETMKIQYSVCVSLYVLSPVK